MARPRREQQDEVTIEWMTPPGTQRQFGMYTNAIREIERRPGQWARLREFERKESAYSAQGALKKKLGEGWEILVRTQEDGLHGLYVRYSRNDKR